MYKYTFLPPPKRKERKKRPRKLQRDGRPELGVKAEVLTAKRPAWGMRLWSAPGMGRNRTVAVMGMGLAVREPWDFIARRKLIVVQPPRFMAENREHPRV